MRSNDRPGQQSVLQGDGQGEGQQQVEQDVRRGEQPDAVHELEQELRRVTQRLRILGVGRPSRQASLEQSHANAIGAPTPDELAYRAAQHLSALVAGAVGTPASLPALAPQSEATPHNDQRPPPTPELGGRDGLKRPAQPGPAQTGSTRELSALGSAAQPPESTLAGVNLADVLTVLTHEVLLAARELAHPPAQKAPEPAIDPAELLAHACATLTQLRHDLR